MLNNQFPTQSELPTSRQLLRSTLLALIAALVLLVTVVMPAEYAIDPTGAGRLLGLTQMAEVKLQLAEEAAADAAAPVAAPAPVAQPAAQTAPEPVVVAEQAVAATVEPEPAAKGQTHEMTFALAPGQGAEIKVEMLKGTEVNFFWSANGGVVNYDTHGDPYNAPRGFYHGYGKGRATPEEKGVLVAAFDGHHGWFWRNRSNKPVTVTLRTEGNYIAIKRVI